MTDESEKNAVKQIWETSVPFKKFWRSYLYMLMHPRKCLRMLNFAGKVTVRYGLNLEDQICYETKKHDRTFKKHDRNKTPQEVDDCVSQQQSEKICGYAQFEILQRYR